jgi:hypothetical protein
MIAGMFLLPQMLLAQTIVEGSSPVLDQTLNDMNAAAKANIEAFSRRMGEKFGVPKETVDILLNKKRMSPADAFMTLNVSKVANRSIEEVTASYEKNKKKGWGAIAKDMGIKPGSAEFHQLKASADSDLNEAKKQKNSKKQRGKSKGHK